MKEARNPTKIVKIDIRGASKFGDKPMYQQPLDAPIAEIQQGLASGEEPADSTITLDQQGGKTIQVTDTAFATSGTGYQKYDSDENGTQRAVQTAAQRMRTSRRERPTTGGYEEEITASGSRKYTFHTEALEAKKDLFPERISVVYINDLQIGSTTMRPDLFIKYADKIRQLLAEGRKVVLFFNGDMIQGRNYPGMPNENAHLGLIRIEDQQALLMKMLDHIFEDISAEELRNVMHVGVLAGNHELNSKSNDTGSTYTHYLKYFFENLFMKKGLGEEMPPVKVYEAMRTKRGEFFKSPTAFENIGGYGLFVQHMILEKGGGKGSGGLPIDQAKTLLAGAPDLLAEVDIAAFGHWHHPQWGLFFEKLAFITAAMAQQSGYELARGYSARAGAANIHMSGGKSVELEFMSFRELATRKVRFIRYYMEPELDAMGYSDDEHVDPLTETFSDKRVKSKNHSGLVKSIHDDIDYILYDAQSEL